MERSDYESVTISARRPQSPSKIEDPPCRLITKNLSRLEVLPMSWCESAERSHKRGAGTGRLVTDTFNGSEKRLLANRFDWMDTLTGSLSFLAVPASDFEKLYLFSILCFRGNLSHIVEYP
ncbi:hypothetical protein TNCV_4290701 [Trichonephila clavipes]|nr:hypothetical protein TNCV_4290701 [Trichonephila clavipes]